MNSVSQRVSGAYLQRICEVSQAQPSSLRALTMRQPCDTIRLLTGLCCRGFRIGSQVCPGYALAAPQIKRSLKADRTQIQRSSAAAAEPLVLA